MPDLSDLMARLGDRTAASLREMWELVLQGHLLPGDFVDAAIGHIVLANGQGQVLAAVDFAQHVADALGELPPDYRAAAPLPHAIDQARIGAGLSTITEAAVTREAMVAATSQLIRYARSEVFEATQRQYSAEMQASKITEGWTRGLEGGACQLCRWWWRDGRVWPATHTMPTHKGCHCRPIPVFKASIRRVSREAREQSAERLAAGGYRQRQQMDVSEYSSRSLGRGTA